MASRSWRRYGRPAWASACHWALAISHPFCVAVRLFSRAFVLDCVALPLVVWGLVELLSVRDDYAIGLLLVGVASAGPLGIKATELARADVPLAITLVALLEAANAFVIPAWVALLLPAGASVPITPVATTLLLLVLCPLLIGLALRRWLREHIDPWVPRLSRTSNVGILIVIALLLIRYLPRIPDSFAAGAGLISVVVVLAALGGGWIIGRPVRSDSRHDGSSNWDTCQRTRAGDRSGLVPVEAERGRCDRDVWAFLYRDPAIDGPHSAAPICKGREEHSGINQARLARAPSHQCSCSPPHPGSRAPRRRRSQPRGPTRERRKPLEPLPQWE